MAKIKSVAVIGGGVIGGGWAARFLAHGLDVCVFDPDPEAARKIGAVIANADRALAKLTAAPQPAKGRLTYHASIAEAVRDADLVQESVPERIELKRQVYAEVDAANPTVLLASSTSGYKPSDLQREMQYPDRLLVAHPFNPVYLLPLVEILGGEKTAPDAVSAAEAFYAGIAMKPLVLKQEIDAFIADRFLEAVWREALWLVKDGIATTAEIDDAIRYGFGLRWAQMGLFETYRVAGGEAGMRHFIAQFGPCLQSPWTRLTDVPDFTQDLIDRIVAQSDDQSGHLDIRDLERIRDDNLVAILTALKGQNWGAGETVAAYEARLFDSAAPATGEPAPDTTKPLCLYRGIVQADWGDYNQHMTEARYLQVFSVATDAAMRFVGCDARYIETAGSFFTAETHICHINEVRTLELFYVETQTLGFDGKRWRLFHKMRHQTSGALLATAEHLMLHVDMTVRKVAPPVDPVLCNLQDLADAQAALPPPEQAGRVGGP